MNICQNATTAPRYKTPAW